MALDSATECYRAIVECAVTICQELHSTYAFPQQKASTINYLIILHVEGDMASVKRKIVRNTAANTFMKLWRYAAKSVYCFNSSFS
jgi:hypothetical protein